MAMLNLQQFLLLRDNEESIKANAGILNPGMNLKLRTKLDPNA